MDLIGTRIYNEGTFKSVGEKKVDSFLRTYGATGQPYEEKKKKPDSYLTTGSCE